MNSGKNTKTSKDIMEAAMAIKKPMPPDIAKKLKIAIKLRIAKRNKYESDMVPTGLRHQAFIDLLNKVSGKLNQNTQTTYVVSELRTTAINAAQAWQRLQKVRYGSNIVGAGISQQKFIDLLQKVTGALPQNTLKNYVVAELTTTAINIAKYGAVIAALVVFIHYTEMDKKIYKFLTEKLKKTHHFRQNRSLFIVSKM